MADRDLICEWKGKLNSIKVCPFDHSSSGVKYEMTWIGELTGRLEGREIGTDYLTMAADGTGSSAYYGVITTRDGEIVLVENHGTLVPTEQGRSRAKFVVKFMTSAPRLAWLTTTTASFETESDFSTDLTTSVFSGAYYMWK